MDRVIYLDVDGVLNPITHKARVKLWPDYRKYDLAINAERTLRIWLSKEMADTIWSLSQKHEVEVVWSTTWLEQANELICPVFGWPELRVLQYEPREDYDYENCGKLPWVDKDAKDKAVCWIDDHLGPVDRSWILNRLEIGPYPTIGIKTIERLGLTPVDLSGIDEFFSNLEG